MSLNGKSRKRCSGTGTDSVSGKMFSLDCSKRSTQQRAELLLRGLAEKTRFFQLFSKDHGYFRCVMFKDQLTSQEKDHRVLINMIVQCRGRGPEDPFGPVPFHSAANRLGCDYTDRSIIYMFVTEIN